MVCMQTNFFQNDAVAHTVFFSSLILLIVILPFDEGGNGYILQLLTQVVLLLWAALWAIRVLRRGQLVLLFDGIDLFVLGFVVWAVISLYFSEYKYATILELLKILSAAALFYLCRTLFPLNERRTTLLIVILGSSLIQLFVALYAFFIRHTPILQAGFVNPNELACFFVIGINIALSVLLFHRPEKDLAIETQRDRAERQKSRRPEEQKTRNSASQLLNFLTS